MVSEQIFHFIMNLWEQMSHKVCRIWTPGHGWQIYIKTRFIAKYRSCVSHGFREDNYFSFAQYRSVYGSGGGQFGSQGHGWQALLFDLILYVPVNNFSVLSGRSSWIEPLHCYLLNIKVVGPIFLSFPIRSLWELLIHGAWPIWTSVV